MRIARGTVLAAALLAGLAAVPGAQSASDETWLTAVDRWNAGRYPEALNGLSALANGPAAAQYHDRIALLTGERYLATEITPDGRNPRISPTGEHVAYDTGPAGTEATTRIAVLRPVVRVVAELPTTTAVFDPTGRRIAWIRSGQPGTPGLNDIVVRDLVTGADTAWPSDGLLKTNLTWFADGIIFVGASPTDSTRTDIFHARPDAPPVRVTSEPGYKIGPVVHPQGAFVAYSLAAASPFGGRASGPAIAASDLAIRNLRTGETRVIQRVAQGTLTMSADGSTLAWIGADADGAATLYRTDPLAPAPIPVRSASASERIAAPALSPNGQLMAYQFQTRVGSSTDWEIYVSDRSGGHRRITRDIQHDVLPRFLDNRTLLGLIGEPRHRRSHLYDLDSGTRTRLFHNNTIRTISPEYAWSASADGRRLAIQADRDGDVVSPARGIYVVDLTRLVTPAELSARLEAQRRHEVDLRARMTTAFAPVAEQVREVVARISETRVYECQRTMASFDSKYVGEPGNLNAIDYLQAQYRSFGYTPEVQWFTTVRGGGANAPRTSNVVATHRGTTNPQLVYVVSSHFDSVVGGTGADDNSSGTCALLETARALSRTPLPATVVFASFTGEEGGLLGSREFVRVARERGWQVAGALNNDMIGWSGDGARIDNTIRYSNAGIRDLQHGAAFLFTDLVLFDSRYYLGTDASTFNEAWGNIVGGIGSYPILANPNYHQASDLLETINFRQVAETAKVTAASVMALASSPAPVKGLETARNGSSVDVTWTAAPEKDVTAYVVTWGTAGEQRITTTTPRAALPGVASRAPIAVKAINARGLESWDWARVVAP